jgi:hypothetical protein
VGQEGIRPERRRHPRFAMRESASAEFLEGVLSVFGWGIQRRVKAILDLSLGGARIRTEGPLEPGSVLRVRIRTEDVPGEIEVYGHTRWCAPTAENSSDFQSGVMFFNVTEMASSQLARLQDRLSRPE